MARQKGSAVFSGTLEVRAGGPADARTVVPSKSDLTASANYPYSYIGMIVSVQDEGKAYMLTAKPTTAIDNWKEIGSGDSGADNIVEGYYNSVDHLFYEESTFDTPITGKNKTLYIDLPSNTTYRFASTIFVRVDEEYGPAYVVEGYRNDTDGLFYREASFTNAITGVTGVIYVALNENATYRFAGSAFTRLDKENSELVFGYYKEADGLMYEEAAFTNAIAGDTSKMYVALNIDKTFRYSGTAFVQLDKEEFENIQVSSLPTASSKVVGKIYQYIGTTTQDYVNGLFYKCVSDGESTPTYSWEQADVQSYSETDLTNVFASGFPTASVTGPRPFSYSTDEQVIGTWVDGKPIYQKTIIGSMPAVETDKEFSSKFIDIEASIDYAHFICAVRKSTTGFVPLPLYYSGNGYQAYFFINGNNDPTRPNAIKLYSNAQTWESQNVYITIQYTKTTD